MDGWLNRHVGGTREGHNWRLVRGTITEGQFVMRGAPQSLRAFDPALAKPALSREEAALVERLMETPRLLPYCTAVPAALEIVREKPHQTIAACVRACLLPGLLLNEEVNAGLQHLAESLSHANDALADTLKREIYRAYAAAADLLPQPRAPEPEGVVEVRLWQLARVAHQLWLPPDLFADQNFVEEFGDQIHLFHSSFWRRWSPLDDNSLLFHFEGASAAWNLNPLVFDLKRPHFLGSLLLGHVFATTISEQTRGEMLMSWINLGAKLRARGDIVGWVAIASVICTPPVLRLRNAWSHVPQPLRQIVSRDWGFEIFELEKRAKLQLLQKSTFRASTEELGEAYPKSACVPYFGDVIVANKPTPEQAEQQLDRLAAVTEGWYFYFNNAPDSATRTTPPPAPYFQELFCSWLRLNRQLPNPLLSAKNQSFQIEPRAFGYYLPHFFNQAQPLSLGSFVPILFTEPIPAFRLLSKNALASAAARPRPAGLQRSNSFPPLTTGVREIENGPREYLSKNGSPHVLVKAIRDLLNVDVETHITANGDLVLKSMTEISSRHSSILEDARAPSSDPSRNSLRNSRRNSLRNSLRNSVQSLELSAHIAAMDLGLEVVVKAASLQRLVDTLVLGVGEFSTQKQRFKINLPSHTETFMATFRSFCSPPELLRLLQNRFFGASEAAFAIVSHRAGNYDLPTFPSWGYTDKPVTGQPLRVLSQIYCNILEALQYWITEFHVDFADDADLTASMRKFLQEMEEHLVNFDQLPAHAKRLNDTFVKLGYRAPDIVPVNCLPPVSRHVVHLPPDPSLTTMQQYLEELDSVVADHFDAISTVDWMQLFETLELQIADPMFLFNYTPSPTTSEDELQIQDIFTYFGTLFRNNPKDKTFTYLPATVKALFKLHNNITDYFAYQISDPMLHVLNRSRTARLADILKMIGILRVRMKFFDLFPNNPEDLSTRVPSFIESAIVAAILRPESRLYASAWLQAGLDVQEEFEAASTPMTLGSVVEKTSEAAPLRAVPNSFTIFIPKIPASALNGEETMRPITPCLGWIMERLFEIVCYIPNMAVENPDLINFDKRRYAYNLIRNIRNEFHYSDLDPKLYTQFDYIINPEVGLYKLDKRLIKESLAREMQGQPKWKLKQRAFTGCVSAELEKMRLEARQYDMLAARTPSITTSSSLSSVSLLDKRLKMRPMSAIVQPPSSGTSSGPGGNQRVDPRQPKSRSRFGSLLKSTVRPLSMAFSSNNINALYASQAPPPTGAVIDPGNLPSLDSSEEKVVASLDLSVCEIRGPRKGIFRIVPSKGTECVMQAPSEADSEKWVEALVAARKRAVAQSQMKPGSTRVFGVPLEIVCKREQSDYPAVVTTLLDRVEEFGLEEVGLYRISGSLAAVNVLKAALDNGERLKATDDRWIDMNVVAGCVKLYLRELPQPLLGPIFEDLVECANVPKEHQLKMLSDCLDRLPGPNYHLLRRIITHLNLVVQHEAVNKMSTPNLAIVFSMNFFPDNAMDRMRPMQSIVNTMIVNQNYLFADSNTSF